MYPCCTSSSSRANEIDAADGVCRYHRLGTDERCYLDQTRKAAMEEYRHRRIEMERRKNCPFAPSLSASPSGDSSGRGLHVQGIRSHSSSVFERLHQVAKEREERLRVSQWKREQHEVGDAESHPFSPAINARPPQAGVLGGSHKAPTRVEDRLLDYGEMLTAKLAHKQHEREREADGQQQSSTAESRQDFYSRNLSLLEKREVQRFLAEQKQLEECSFHPKVSSSSAALDAKRRQREVNGAKTNADADNTTLDIAAVMAMSNGQTAEERVARFFNKPAAPVQPPQPDTTQQSETFSPRINPSSNNWIRDSHHEALFKKSFLDRQVIYQRVSEEERRRLDEQHTIQDLHTNVEGSEERRLYRAAIEEQVDRLYSGYRNTPSSAAGYRNPDEGECTFHPLVSPGSELVVKRAKNREVDFVKRLTARNEKDCNQSTTQSESSAPGKSESISMSKEEASAFFIRQQTAATVREHRLREEKKKQQMRETLQCTFQPRTTTFSKKKDPEGLSKKVMGISKYLQRQEDAKRLQKEKEEALNQRSGMPINGYNYTLFTPFDLKTEYRHQLRTHSRNGNRDELPGEHRTSFDAVVDGDSVFRQPCTDNLADKTFISDDAGGVSDMSNLSETRAAEQSAGPHVSLFSVSSIHRIKPVHSDPYKS